jgi:hypothetical protein
MADKSAVTEGQGGLGSVLKENRRFKIFCYYSRTIVARAGPPI